MLVIDSQLEQKSFRRGSLQTLSRAGVDEATMMHFSGHATVRMLHRYLNWGAVNGAVALKSHEAARHLMLNADDATEELEEDDDDL